MACLRTPFPKVRIRKDNCSRETLVLTLYRSHDQELHHPCHRLVCPISRLIRGSSTNPNGLNTPQLNRPSCLCQTWLISTREIVPFITGRGMGMSVVIATRALQGSRDSNDMRWTNTCPDANACSAISCGFVRTNSRLTLSLITPRNSRPKFWRESRPRPAGILSSF